MRSRRQANFREGVAVELLILVMSHLSACGGSWLGAASRGGVRRSAAAAVPLLTLLWHLSPRTGRDRGETTVTFPELMDRPD